MTNAEILPPMDISQWVNNPPEIEKSPVVDRGVELFNREAVPLDRVDLSKTLPKRGESYEPAPASLSPDYLWLFPAMAYSLMAMDRSLFDLYSWGLDKSPTIKTYKTGTPVALLEGIDISRNPWFYTIQGLHMDEGLKFLDYISTFRFNDKIRNRSWCLQFSKVRLSDPFASTPRGFDLTVLLPKALDKSRAAIIVREPSLTLGPLVLGIHTDAV